MRLLPTLVFFATLAAAADSPEAQVARAEEAHGVAVNAKDVVALDQIEADDYVFIMRDGQISDKKQDLEGLKVGMRAARETTGQKIRVYGNTAVVTGTAILTISSGKVPVAFTRVWVKTGGAWRLVSAQGAAIVNQENR